MVAVHTAIAIVLVIALIIKVRVDPVISLILGSLYLGLAAGVGFAGTVEAITLGFGGIMAEVGLLDRLRGDHRSTPALHRRLPTTCRPAGRGCRRGSPPLCDDVAAGRRDAVDLRRRPGRAGGSGGPLCVPLHRPDRPTRPGVGPRLRHLRRLRLRDPRPRCHLHRWSARHQAGRLAPLRRRNRLGHRPRVHAAHADSSSAPGACGTRRPTRRSTRRWPSRRRPMPPTSPATPRRRGILKRLAGLRVMEAFVMLTPTLDDGLLRGAIVVSGRHHREVVPVVVEFEVAVPHLGPAGW